MIPLGLWGGVMSYAVLIADDNPFGRELVCLYADLILRRNYGMDIAIHPAEDGRGLVDISGKINPDLIITDQEMPVLSGIEAAIMAVSARKIPVVVVSSSEDYRGAAERAGFVFVLRSGEYARDLTGAFEKVGLHKLEEKVFHR